MAGTCTLPPIAASGPTGGMNTTSPGSSLMAAANVLETGHRFEQNRSTLSLPIAMDEEPIGTIVIRAETLDIRQRLLRYLSLGGLVLIASGIVAFLIATRLQRSISLPILRLVATSRRVSFEKNYSVRAEAGGAATTATAGACRRGRQNY